MTKKITKKKLSPARKSQKSAGTKDPSQAKLHAVAMDAYAPYSKFHVSAQVETDKGEFLGCNIENASYGATVCAERVAIWKAVSEGARKFHTITIYAPKKEMIPPCALCLQVMAEFCEKETQIVLTNLTGKHERYHFEDLLTFPFGPSYLKK